MGLRSPCERRGFSLRDDDHLRGDSLALARGPTAGTLKRPGRSPRPTRRGLLLFQEVNDERVAGDRRPAGRPPALAARPGARPLRAGVARHALLAAPRTRSDAGAPGAL